MNFPLLRSSLTARLLLIWGKHGMRQVLESRQYNDAYSDAI